MFIQPQYLALYITKKSMFVDNLFFTIVLFRMMICRRNCVQPFLFNIVFFVVDLCTTASVRKAAIELGKVKEMYEKIYVIVEKDGEKKSDPSK